MDFVWPTFSRLPLNAVRSWSATFESFDQRNDDCYYEVTIYEGDREVERFSITAGVGWVKDGEWTSPTFVPKLQEQLQAIIAAHIVS